MIEDFIVVKNKSSIQWLSNNKPVLIEVDGLDQAMVDEKRHIVFVLSGHQQLPTRLDVWDETGENLFSCSPPPGSDFYYLTKTSTYDVLVVCTFEEKFEGWHDWHYYFDQKSMSLHQGAPAY